MRTTTSPNLAAMTITPTDSLHFSFNSQCMSIEPIGSPRPRKRTRKSKYMGNLDKTSFAAENFFFAPDASTCNDLPVRAATSVAKSHWSAEEDQVLREAQARHGNSWIRISKLLPGRSEHAVKNRWNSWRKKHTPLKRVSSSGPRHTCGAGSSQMQARKESVVGIYGEFVTDQQEREDFFRSVTFTLEDKLEMMKSIKTSGEKADEEEEEEDIVKQMASDMVAQMSSKRIASLQEQQPLNDPFNSLLESSLLWLDLPLLRTQISQPPTPAAKSSFSLALKADSFENVTHSDTVVMSKAVKDFGKATKAGRKRLHIEVTEAVQGFDSAVMIGSADFDLDSALTELGDLGSTPLFA